MKEMKLYKKIIILLIPIIFWIIEFFITFVLSQSNNDGVWNFLTFLALFRYLFAFLIIPTIYAILSWNFAKNIKETSLFYIISYVSQVLGFLLNGVLYCKLISNDAESVALAYGGTQLLAIILGVVYLLAIIFYILIKLIDKIPERK